jgi:hypothetical protein
MLRPMPPSARKQEVVPALEAGAPPARTAAPCPMSLELALDLVLCGVFVIGLSFLAQQLQPDLHHATLFVGVVAGGLCIGWGVLGRRGTRCHGGAVLTLAVMACVFVLQAYGSWEAPATPGSKPGPVFALMMVLVVFCVGVLAKVAQEGRRPEP